MRKVRACAFFLYLLSMEEMTFEAYLKWKKIDPAAFKKAEKEQFDSLKKVFDQVSPTSFTQQKLFLINPIRRKFPFTEEAVEAPKKKPMARPKIMKPKTK